MWYIDDTGVKGKIYLNWKKNVHLIREITLKCYKNLISFAWRKF